jgi:hypothetical protein
MHYQFSLRHTRVYLKIRFRENCGTFISISSSYSQYIAISNLSEI